MRRDLRRSKWIGPLHLTTRLSFEEERRVEGCGCVVSEVDDATGETIGTSYAKGYSIRYRGREAVVVAWRSKYAGCPMSPGLWLRLKRHHLMWVLRGRPAPVPQGVSCDGGCDPSDPTMAAHLDAIDRAYR